MTFDFVASGQGQWKDVIYRPNGGSWKIKLGRVMEDGRGWRYGNRNIGYDGFVLGSKHAAAMGLLFDYTSFLWRKTRGHGDTHVINTLTLQKNLDALILWSNHRVHLQDNPYDKYLLAQTVLMSVSELTNATGTGEMMLDKTIERSIIYVTYRVDLETPTAIYDGLNEKFVWGVSIAEYMDAKELGVTGANLWNPGS